MKPGFHFTHLLIAVILATGIAVFGGCTAAPATENTTAVNGVPAISFVEGPLEVMPSSSSNFICEASDPDNDVLTYTWTARDGVIVGGGSGITWNAPAQSGSYTVNVSVTDGKGGEASKSLTVTVMEKPNVAPKVISFLITKADKSQLTYTPGESNEPVSVQALTTAEIQANVEDPEGDSYNIRWFCTDGGRLEGVDNPIHFIAITKNTNVSVTATVTDEKGAMSKATLLIKIPCCGEGQFGQSGT